MSPAPPATGPDREGDEIEVFTRDRGVAGVRNRVVVIPSVICSRMVAARVAETVEHAWAAGHDQGCGQIGADRDATARTMINVGANPNVAGVTVVGLGCESVQSDEVVAGIERHSVPVESVDIQDVGGTEACLAVGRELTTELVDAATAAGRSSIPIGQLTVGVVAGDLRPSTVETAEPVVAELLADLHASGARTVFAGTPRFLAARDGLKENLATETAQDGFETMLARTANRRGAPTQTERDAADRSMDELTGLLGNQPITEVLAYGERAARDRGTVLVDAPMEFEQAATALAAAGAHLIVHITADGVPTGHPIVPVIKVTGEPTTAAALASDIDIDATQQTVADLRERVVAVASGQPSCAEQHGVTGFSIGRLGPSM